MPRSFSHIVLFLFTFPLLLLQLLQNYQCYFCHRYCYFHTTLLQILSYPGVVELTTQLLILENILWLPLCRINKFGLNTLPSKAVAIPYTCGLSISEAQVGHPFQPGPEHTKKGPGGQTAVLSTCARCRRWRLVEDMLPRGAREWRKRWVLTQQTIDEKVAIVVNKTKAETKAELLGVFNAAVNEAMAGVMAHF